MRCLLSLGSPCRALLDALPVRLQSNGGMKSRLQRSSIDKSSSCCLQGRMSLHHLRHGYADACRDARALRTKQKPINQSSPCH